MTRRVEEGSGPDQPEGEGNEKLCLRDRRTARESERVRESTEADETKTDGMRERERSEHVSLVRASEQRPRAGRRAATATATAIV